MDTLSIRELVAEYDRLLDAFLTAPREDLTAADKALSDFIKEYPGIVDYDSDGNWIGPMSYENGWSA